MSSTGLADSAAKRVRSSGSRSHSACITCKIRRVKCGEEKPHCTRCKNFGRICDGYEIKKASTRPPPPKKARTVTGTRNLLPVSLAPINPFAPVPATISFQDEAQERYFHLFHNETVIELASGFPSELWGYSIPRACHDEPCILHCAVALSALSKAFKLASSPTLCHTADSHHQYALHQYGKALTGLRKVIARGGNPLRIILIAALLIFCFENFHGDVRLALTNIQSAVDLVHDWLANDVHRGTSPDFSPTPGGVEDSIVTAFTHLDIHLLNWIDSPHPIRGSILKYAATNTSPIPTRFKTFQEASICFEHVANEAFQFLRSVRETRRRCEGLPHNDVYDDNGNQFVESPAAFNLRCWLAAFKPIFDQTRGQNVEMEFLGASLMRTHGLILTTAMRSTFFNPGEIHRHDIFLPEYCEIVALCREIAQHPRFIKGFVFDIGIISALFVVVMKCPDRAVRLEALLALDIASPRREGVWDSLVVLRIGQELMRLEDEIGALPDGVEVHLNCLSMTFQLPKPSNKKYEHSLGMVNYFYDYMNHHNHQDR